MANYFLGRFDPSMLEDMGEFQKRYQDTYLYLKTATVEDLCYCEEVHDERVTFNSSLYGKLEIQAESECELEVRWPIPQLFNHGNTILSSVRYPERQWKRAPCSKTVRIVDLVKGLFQGELSYRDLDSSLLCSAMSQPQPYRDILTTINAFKKSEIVGRALTSTFAVTLPPNKTDNYVLFYRTAPVGLIYPEQKKIQVKYPHLLQEVKDFIRDFEENQWIIFQ